jgi:hypothetical protein
MRARAAVWAVAATLVHSSSLSGCATPPAQDAPAGADSVAAGTDGRRPELTRTTSEVLTELDTAAVERTSDRVRAVHVTPESVEVRVGQRLPEPRAWATDSAGRAVVGFVPLWTIPNDAVVGRRGGYPTALRPGRTVLRVRPVRWHPRSGAEDPVVPVPVVVTP